jgi:hypothetical protein
VCAKCQRKVTIITSDERAHDALNGVRGRDEKIVGRRVRLSALADTLRARVGRALLRERPNLLSATCDGQCRERNHDHARRRPHVFLVHQLD